jgi:hypothetical protein
MIDVAPAKLVEIGAHEDECHHLCAWNSVIHVHSIESAKVGQTFKTLDL